MGEIITTFRNTVGGDKKLLRAYQYNPDPRGPVEVREKAQRSSDRVRHSRDGQIDHATPKLRSAKSSSFETVVTDPSSLPLSVLIVLLV